MERLVSSPNRAVHFGAGIAGDRAACPHPGLLLHSDRRTAITNWAREITQAGGSLRDVQSLAGHASLANAHRHIDQSPRG
jgi:hypothetical protein